MSILQLILYEGCPSSATNEAQVDVEPLNIKFNSWRKKTKWTYTADGPSASASLFQQRFFDVLQFETVSILVSRYCDPSIMQLKL